MSKVRIQNFNLTITDCARLLSGNCNNSLQVCLQVYRSGPKVDPDDFFGGLGSLLMLDTLNIWDADIYALYADVCNSNISKVIAILRAYQLGQLAGVTEDAIKHAISNKGEGIDIEAVVKAVKERLPDFNPY